jgi:predicted acylesterase/phospholipase RssA
VLLALYGVAQAEDPCASVKQRALVLSGGGVKGAFEAGAVYHLVVQRGCDFSEFSGVSVGALNAVFLAQALESADTSESHANLVDQSEALVSLWQSLNSARDFARPRPLATLRFGLFGLDSLVDFTPLRHLEKKNISLDKLKRGRPVRIGVVSFDDGRYHEILADQWLTTENKVNFLDYLYASSIPPVFGRLPRIAGAKSTSEATQFADGSLRHITPVTSYFVECITVGRPAPRLLAVSQESSTENCLKASDTTSAHGAVQQLFVIVTSPYSRISDSLPLADCACNRHESRQFTDGRKIFSRALEVMDDSVYRRDLDFLLSANDELRWRWQAYQRLVLDAAPKPLMDARSQFLGSAASALESYNRDPDDPGAPSRPYEIGLVSPNREFADLKNILKFSRSSTQEQLYCGCMAANEMMIADFGLFSLAGGCAERFPRRPRSSWTCHAGRRPFVAQEEE